MTENSIKVNSLTSAARGREILLRNGFRNAEIVRANKDLAKDGCGYMLVFEGDSEKALHLLEKHGIKVRGSAKM